MFMRDIYIHIYIERKIFLYIYIYIHIYIERKRGRRLAQAAPSQFDYALRKKGVVMELYLRLIA